MSTRLGTYISNEIHHNEYFAMLYTKLLKLYGIKVLNLQTRNLAPKEEKDLLRFADLLSKTAPRGDKDDDKELAQEILLMLDALSPNNAAVLTTLQASLTESGNYVGIQTKKIKQKQIDFFDEIYSEVDKESLQIPNTENKYFLPAQKQIFNNLNNPTLSFSGPTSLGKTFLFLNFVKQEIDKGVHRNFYIILPTRALVNEVRTEIANELGPVLRQAGYTVKTSSFSSAADVIFVMTPERFLVHLEKQDCYHPDYIFIDEAQTIITGKERSLLYYRIVDRVARLKQDFNIMFSSPNIPNPEVFSKLIPSSSGAQYFSGDCKSALSSKYTPVSHFIFFADLVEKKIDIINRLSSEYVPLVGIKTPNTDTLNFVKRIGKGKNNVVYISSIQKAMEWALSYAADCKLEEIPLENQQKLNEASDFIKEKIHSLCYLSETIKKGVAYHIGYLPSSVRKLIEKLFRAGVIHTIFCTSTIIDGVNFPADNLFITSLKRGSSDLTEVEFRNLMGRSGRIKYQLFGNIFFIRSDESVNPDKALKLATDEVPKQILSVEQTKFKKLMTTAVKSLTENDLSLGGEAKNHFARTFSTLLTRDLSLGLDDSFLVQATKAVATTEEIEKIKNNFPQAITFENYSLTHDQAERLKVYIENGGEYPSFNGYNYSWVYCKKVKKFLSDLKYVFMWKTYEKSTLGKGNSTDWFALLLAYWIEGKPIAVIINEKIKKYDKGEYKKVFCNKQKYQYDGSIKHKNYIINQILDDIDKILLFKLGDYFSIFSEEYKQQKGDDSLFYNDWATFVEYGTGNWKLIELQKLGFSRENAKYVFAHAEEYEVHFAGDNPDIDEEPNGYLTLGFSILDDPNSSIREEANEIYNIEPWRFKSLDSFYDGY